MINLFVRNIAMRFGVFARWIDLLLGIATVTAGAWYDNWWLIAFGIFSLASFGFNLNGRIQRWTSERAQAHVRKRSQAA